MINKIVKYFATPKYDLKGEQTGLIHDKVLVSNMDGQSTTAYLIEDKKTGRLLIIEPSQIKSIQ